MFTSCKSGIFRQFWNAMKPIEIRLDPAMVETLLESLSPIFDKLESELASPALLPEEDEVMEDFWKRDLLESQKNEVAVMRGLFNQEFMETGRALIEPDDMDRVLRSCSAIRLKLRDTVLKDLNDETLEQGELEEVAWTKELQLGYASYALFASLQEIIVSQMNGETSAPEAGEELEGEEDLPFDEDEH